MQKTIRGYKVANADGKCRGHLFEVGKDYKFDGIIRMCSSGFHFCLKASHCFSYYSFDSNNVVFEVEAIGQFLAHDEDSKICTDHIKIIRKIDWSEVLQIANDGKNNTGHSNTGDSNTGDRNTGDWNTGYSNTGDWNTGDWNTGDRNTGYSNTGDWNTGDWNTGDRNTGYSNTGDRNTGAFCTIDAPFPMFNKKSNWTENDFKNSSAYSLMVNSVYTKIWVQESQMTNEEKEANPSFKTTSGYLKNIQFKDAFQNAWHNWTEKNRKAFTDLPNFDASIFEEITGVKAI